jgi:hypothetical protein
MMLNDDQSLSNHEAKIFLPRKKWGPRILFFLNEFFNLPSGRWSRHLIMVERHNFSNCHSCHDELQFPASGGEG